MLVEAGFQLDLQLEPEAVEPLQELPHSRHLLSDAVRNISLPARQHQAEPELVPIVAGCRVAALPLKAMKRRSQSKKFIVRWRSFATVVLRQSVQR